MYILYTYIANIRLIASTPQHRNGQFNCWWRFPVFSLVPFTNFQLKVPYYFLLASGLKYLPPNISEKFISSIGYKSFNNCLSKGTLSTPPACSYAIWTRERKKEANPTFGSCAIQILKTAQFWRGVAFLFAYTVDWRYSQLCSRGNFYGKPLAAGSQSWLPAPLECSLADAKNAETVENDRN